MGRQQNPCRKPRTANATVRPSPLIAGATAARGIDVPSGLTLTVVVVRRDGSNEQLISADTRGTPADSVGGTDLSGDGRFVAFSSSDHDLVARDTNGVADVFTRAVNVGVRP
jgi:hypothetical protein